MNCMCYQYIVTRRNRSVLIELTAIVDTSACRCKQKVDIIVQGEVSLGQHLSSYHDSTHLTGEAWGNGWGVTAR